MILSLEKRLTVEGVRFTRLEKRWTLLLDYKNWQEKAIRFVFKGVAQVSGYGGGIAGTWTGRSAGPLHYRKGDHD